MKKRVIVIVPLLFIILCGTVFAYTRVSGVKEGQYFSLGNRKIERVILAKGQSIEYLEVTKTKDIQKLYAAVETIDAEPIVPSMTGEPVWHIELFSESDASKVISLSRWMNEYESWIEIDDICYKDNEELNKLYQSLFIQYAIKEEVLCKEPRTREEYTQVAEKLFKTWINGYKEVETAPYYQIKELNLNKVTFIKDGYYNGRREFVVDFLYQVKPSYKNNYFMAVNKVSSFNHYTRIRLAYENGKCKILDKYHEQALNNELLDGLSGIINKETVSTKQFNAGKTFEDKLQKDKIILSHNEVKMANGKIVTIQIECEKSRILETGKAKNDLGEEVNTVTGTMWANVTVDGCPTHRPSVYFDEATSSLRASTYKEMFDLAFEDYNEDGNPDYLIKLREEKNGSWYHLNCLTDSGLLSSETNVFVANSYKESVLLEKVQKGIFKSYGYDEKGELIPVYYNLEGKISFNDNQVPQYNVQVKVADFYDGLTLTIWNNSKKAVKVGGSCWLEKEEAGDFKLINQVASNIKSEKLEALGYINQNISLHPNIQELESGNYRIGLIIEGQKYYATFSIPSSQEIKASLQLVRTEAIANVKYYELSLTNLSEVGFTYHQKPILEINRGGNWEQVTYAEHYYFTPELVCAGRAEVQYVLYQEMFAKALEPGEYRLTLTAKRENGNEKLVTTIFELEKPIVKGDLKPMSITITPKKQTMKQKQIQMTITNTSPNHQTIYVDIARMYLEVELAGKQYEAFKYMTPEFSQIADIPYGESYTIILTNRILQRKEEFNEESILVAQVYFCYWAEGSQIFSATCE